MPTGNPTDCTYIYCLIDPDTDQVRYVGKANDVLKRYKQHLRENRRSYPVYSWITSLKQKGQTPIVASLSRVLMSAWEEVESLWIEVYRRKGAPLLNLTAGGDGTTNPFQIDGKRGELARLKHRVSINISKGYGTEKTRAKLRLLADKYPNEFGQWANV